MLISILTPSFNQAIWLKDNIYSVHKQTYPWVEHIVMDGGSTDGSIGILESSRRVIWRSEPDRGQSHALNKAFAVSSGEIIGWMNSDDAYFDQNVLESVARYFHAHQEVDVAYGHAARTNSAGKIVYLMWAPPFSYRSLHWSCYLFQPAVFIRRSALNDGFVDETYQFAMDWELWLRLGKTHRFGRMDRVLAIDRVHPARKMKTWIPVLEKERIRLGAAYGVTMPAFYAPMDRATHLIARIAGARLACQMPDVLAFPGVQDGRCKVLRRQIASRQRNWPQEDR